MFVSNAGRNEKFENILAASEEKIQKSMRFFGQDKDPVFYINELSLQMKSETGKILFRDRAGDMRYCPCITQFVSFIDPSVKFPKDKKRNKFECAKIQYVLGRVMESDMKMEHMINKISSFQCDCKDCYNIAFRGLFDGDRLCL